MSKGRLLVIEGLDGSGKATQAKLLAAHLAESGRKVMEITHSRTTRAIPVRW